ncbi:hypothetical protein SVAN01_00999 [Stagonosporopsis vannaccii]|nr:hypothetical protein SVAN01_00999 [Stagonosporopsis vannaccii]
MSGPAVLVPAAQAGMDGVPAFAQHAGQANKNFNEKTGAPQAAVKRPRGPRRKPGDHWPVPMGNEVNDVQRLFDWVHRGSHKPSQRMINFRGQRIDVSKAWAVLEREGRVGAQLPAFASGHTHMSPFAAPQVPALFPGNRPQQFTPHFSFLPNTSFPDTHLVVPEGMDYHPGALPAHPFAFQTPFPTHPVPFPPQQLGYHSPSLPPPQVAMPAHQQAGSHPASHCVFDPALQFGGTGPPLGNFDGAEFPGGPQGEVFAPNGAVGRTEELAGGEVRLMDLTQEEKENINRMVAEGFLSQPNVALPDVVGAVQVSGPAAEQQLEGAVGLSDVDLEYLRNFKFE